VKIEQCEIAGDCPQQNNTQCADGHDGPICANCLPSYTRSVAGGCEQCNAISKSSITLAVVVPLTLLLILALWWRRRQSRSKAKSSTADTILEVHNKKHWANRLKTKVKILSSSFQIVCEFAATLRVDFPPVFSGFTLWLSAIVKLEYFQLGAFGCMVDTGFYNMLLFYTLTPIFITLLLVVYNLLGKVMYKSDKLKQKEIFDNCFTFFLTMTFAVYAVVSARVFNTFLCDTYGDDTTNYLVADQRIDCDSAEHKLYKWYARLMILIYPVGIPVLYLSLLMKQKDVLQLNDNDKTKMTNTEIKKLAFLYDEYEPQYWWFEVYVCVQRMSLTGLLVFIKPGTVIQVLVGIGFSMFSIWVYFTTTPFVKDSDDTLANITQLSMFFTLFGALLSYIDQKSVYDAALFGYIMVAVNVAGLVLAVSQAFVKPVKRFARAIGRKHVHNGTLQPLHGDESAEEFLEYCEKLLVSGVDETGWETISASKFKKGWVEETGSICEWTCMSGDGPMDVCRVKFVVDGNIEKVFDSIVDVKLRTRGTIEQKLVGESSEEYDQTYMAVKMPFPCLNRDLVMERFHRKRRGDGSMLEASRSIENDEVKSLKESSQKRRVRGDIKCGAYLLRGKVDEFSGKEQVEIIHVAAVDLNGVFGLDLLYRIAAVERIKGVVDSNVNRFTRGIVVEDEDVERGRGSSIFNVFSGVKQRMMGGGGGKKLIEEAGIELSEIYGGGKEDISGVNPLAREAGKGPNGVKPQDDWAS